MLRYGEQIRDRFIWEYPALPGAVYTYQQMASGREWRLSGSAVGVARAYEWLQNATTRTYDGMVYVGFEDYLRRRALDYIAVGRTIFHAGAELTYVDPCYCRWDAQTRVWEDSLNDKKYPVDQVTVNHPIPIGAMGSFMSPLAMIMPIAMLVWLVQEHDKAAIDGRRLRDVVLVVGKDLAENIQSSIESMISAWSGKDPASNEVLMAYTEPSSGVSVRAADLVTTIGVSKIPEGFDRRQLWQQYVNEIAAGIGVALRHFWNGSDQYANRALEEVQEARATQKGPTVFVRSEQRQLNHFLKRFGRNVRLAFDEEVDTQSQKVNAEVLKLNAEALQIFAGVLGVEINSEAWVAWMQSLGQLPADIDLVTAKQGVLQTSDQTTAPIGDNAIQPSDEKPTSWNVDGKKSLALGDDDGLEHDEVMMDSKGQVIARRPRVFSLDSAVYESIVKTYTPEPEPVVDFEKALADARARLNVNLNGDAS